MANERYYDQFNREKYEKFNEILDELPYFCNEYFTGVDMRTSVLTKLNYATDLAIFFDFLTHKVRGFVGKQIVDISIKDIECGGITNFVLSTDGDVFAFGSGGNGQVGFDVLDSSLKENPLINGSNVIAPVKIEFYQPINIKEKICQIKR